MHAGFVLKLRLDEPDVDSGLSTGDRPSAWSRAYPTEMRSRASDQYETNVRNSLSHCLNYHVGVWSLLLCPMFNVRPVAGDQTVRLCCKPQDRVLRCSVAKRCDSERRYSAPPAMSHGSTTPPVAHNKPCCSTVDQPPAVTSQQQQQSLVPDRTQRAAQSVYDPYARCSPKLPVLNTAKQRSTSHSRLVSHDVTKYASQPSLVSAPRSKISLDSGVLRPVRLPNVRVRGHSSPRSFPPVSVKRNEITRHDFPANENGMYTYKIQAYWDRAIT